jgi:hypothetical protein
MCLLVDPPGPCRDLKLLNVLQKRYQWARDIPLPVDQLPLWASYFVLADPVGDLRNTSGLFNRPVGTCFYPAPEVQRLVSGSSYESGPADMWAFAIIWLQCRYVRVGCVHVFNSIAL